MVDDAKSLLVKSGKFPTINMLHLLEGEIEMSKKGIKEFKGLHTSLLKPQCIEKIVNEPNQHGIYEAIVRSECGILKEKPSSFFPDDWSKEKIIEKIKEAFNNPIQELSNGKIGITKEGVEIQIWFKKIMLNGEKIITIDNAYPLYKK